MTEEQANIIIGLLTEVRNVVVGKETGGLDSIELYAKEQSIHIPNELISEVYANYKHWCMMFDHLAVSQTVFSRAIKTFGYSTKQYMDGGVIKRVYVEIED